MIEKLSKPLNKEDIELRIGSVSKGKGFSLLAYKTARTDTNRLNQVCGTKWKNRFYIDENMYQCCEISIYDSEIKEWIPRSDVGTESQTEKEKGSYSDAFKRAGFKWGIGIELYKFPFIWINWSEFDERGRPKGFNAPSIKEYIYNNGHIQKLVIEHKGKVIYTYENHLEEIEEYKIPTPSKLTTEQKRKVYDDFKAIFENENLDFNNWCSFMNWDMQSDNGKKQALGQMIKFLNDREMLDRQISDFKMFLNQHKQDMELGR